MIPFILIVIGLCLLSEEDQEADAEVEGRALVTSINTPGHANVNTYVVKIGDTVSSSVISEPFDQATSPVYRSDFEVDLKYPRLTITDQADQVSVTLAILSQDPQLQARLKSIRGKVERVDSSVANILKPDQTISIRPHGGSTSFIFNGPESIFSVMT